MNFIAHAARPGIELPSVLLAGLIRGLPAWAIRRTSLRRTGSLATVLAPCTLDGMGKSWHYPAWRRLLMQATLCLILFATLGLAMVVSHRKMGVKLTTVRWAGNIGAQLPYGWILLEENRPPVVFQIREPGTEHRGRLMTIRSELVASGTDAMTYLREGTLLEGSKEVLGAEAPQAVTIAGAPGLLVLRRRPVAVDIGDDEMPTIDIPVWFAAVVLPSGQAISIELRCPVEIDPEADRTIVLNTAAAIEISGTAAK